MLAFLVVASLIFAAAGELYAGNCDDDCHKQCENCEDCTRCVSSIDMIDYGTRLTIQSCLNSSWIVLSLSANYDNVFLEGPDHPPRFLQ